MPLTLSVLGAVALGVWIYLLLFRGGFWRISQFDDQFPSKKYPEIWPRVVAIIPARNEAETIGRAVAGLLQQDYSGEFSVLVVDDQSDDGTALAAQRAARKSKSRVRMTVESTAPLPAGWTGKVWALHEGVRWSSAEQPTYYWFTDADVVHAPDTLRRLVARAERSGLDLTSLMVLLHVETIAERLLIPAFLFFFLKLYPPTWIAEAKTRTAGAAGGCILLKRKALDLMGGLEAIRGEVIDDCALARAVKHSGGRIWMGLTRTSVSVRVYREVAEIQDMIARTAFTQLRYSTIILLASLLGMAITYFLPVALTFSSYSVPRRLGFAAWVLMILLYIPTLQFYGVRIFWAPVLPFAALFYFYATCISAVRYWLGRGGQWKGRAQAGRSNT